MNLALLIIAGSIGAAIGINTAVEQVERNKIFQQAREYADQVNKPLLVVGTPKNLPFAHSHPCGDITIDLNPNISSNCSYEIADIRAIPYPNNYFGAAYCSHVLEHLATEYDAIQALDELYRVADEVFVVVPRKTSIVAWLHPDHHLWVTPSGDGYIIEQRGNAPAQEYSYLTSMQVI